MKPAVGYLGAAEKILKECQEYRVWTEKFSTGKRETPEEKEEIKKTLRKAVGVLEQALADFEIEGDALFHP